MLTEMGGAIQKDVSPPINNAGRGWAGRRVNPV